MDRRLKERLIGAAVLVAVGVWIIPWALDGRQDPPEAPSDPLELPAPSDIAPIRTETLRLDGVPEEAVVPTRIAPEPVLEDAAPEPVLDAAAAPETAGPRPESPEAEDESAPVVAVPAAPAESAEPARSAPAPVTAVGAWLVQLGAFGDAENAQRLADRVNEVGFDAEVSAFRSGGRTMHRVRVGPPAARARAEAAASALSAHGFVAQVVSVD
jgi:DedD protein